MPNGLLRNSSFLTLLILNSSVITLISKLPWNNVFWPTSVLGKAVSSLCQLQPATAVGPKALALAQRRYSTVLLLSLRRLEDGQVRVPEKFKKSCTGFSQNGPKLWNFLPSDIRTTDERKVFKAKLKNWIWTSIPST